jgi:lipid-binding SYLF domain-containing protein
MKKFLSLLFAFTALAGALSADPVVTRATVIEHLDSCEAILQDLQGNFKTAVPADILRRAKGIVIVNQFQAGFIFGVKDGYAVAMARRPNGKWSVPAFLRTGELSFGLQAGGKSVTAVYLLMDDTATRLLFKSKFNLGAETKANAGIRAAERESSTASIGNEANVLVYTSSEGLYLGAAIKTGYMSPDNDANRLFYNSSNRIPELLFSDWVTPPPEAHFLMDYVTRLTQ